MDSNSSGTNKKRKLTDAAGAEDSRAVPANSDTVQSSPVPNGTAHITKPQDTAPVLSQTNMARLYPEWGLPEPVAVPVVANPLQELSSSETQQASDGQPAVSQQQRSNHDHQHSQQSAAELEMLSPAQYHHLHDDILSSGQHDPAQQVPLVTQQPMLHLPAVAQTPNATHEQASKPQLGAHVQAMEQHPVLDQYEQAVSVQPPVAKYHPSHEQIVHQQASEQDQLHQQPPTQEQQPGHQQAQSQPQQHQQLPHQQLLRQQPLLQLQHPNQLQFDQPQLQQLLQQQHLLQEQHLLLQQQQQQQQARQTQLQQPSFASAQPNLQEQAHQQPPEQPHLQPQAYQQLRGQPQLQQQAHQHPPGQPQLQHQAHQHPPGQPQLQHQAHQHPPGQPQLQHQAHQHPPGQPQLQHQAHQQASGQPHLQEQAHQQLPEQPQLQPQAPQQLPGQPQLQHQALQQPPARTQVLHPEMNASLSAELRQQPGAGPSNTAGLPSTNLGAYSQRELFLQKLEDSGEMSFEYVLNDGQRHNNIWLIALKNIFSKQLPNMPREYIARLVLDRRHRSVAIVRQKRNVVGGITYRPFHQQGFGEIAFCAVTANEQVKGFGTRLMNFTKEYAKTQDHLTHFLTYADNNAVGYFAKQGFTKEITLDKECWVGFIKDYDGGTLMECVIVQRLPHTRLPAMLQAQKMALESCIRHYSKSHVVREGLKDFQNGARHVNIASIPGVKEAGWDPGDSSGTGVRLLMNNSILDATPNNLQHFMLLVVHQMQACEDFWCFLLPVLPEDVPDYCDVIKDPVDLSLMERRLKQKDYYLTLDIFAADMRRIFNNCRLYNTSDSIWYKSANRAEAFFDHFMHTHLLFGQT